MKNNKVKLTTVETLRRNNITYCYSRVISDNVKRVYELKRKKSEWIGVAPIGYVNTSINGITRTQKTIAIDKKQSPIIQKMFALLAGGNETIRTIKMKVSKMGIKRA